MRLFQSLHKYVPYIPNFERRYDVEGLSYAEHYQTLLNDRFYALHLLQPVLEQSPDAFYALWNYEALQHKWAAEKGWRERDLKKILFAQIEEFQPDVWYNYSPNAFSKEDLQTSVDPKLTRLCWSASPYYDNNQLRLYQTRLTNLPSDVRPKEEVGFRNDLFQPAYDSEMAAYAANEDRPVDLFFYGQYADDGFKNRNAHLERLLAFQKERPDLRIEFCLQYPVRKAPVVNIPYIRRFWQRTTFPPAHVVEQSEAPVYGRELYHKLGQSKVVFNAGVNFTGEYKGNMRCTEVTGCGAHMLTDEGFYPPGYEAGKTMTTYRDIEDCIGQFERLLQDAPMRKRVARAGHEMVRTQYTKTQQWNHFQEIVASL